jgi:Tfp pilus assembly protein PilP
MTINSRTISGVIAATVLAVGSSALAQQPAPKAAPPAPGTPAPPAVKKVDLPAPPPNFEYTPQGRRDPFISLLNRGDDGKNGNGPTAKRADGVPGMLVGELNVRGIMQTRGAWVAMVSGADGKVYSVRSGDKLADGVIRQITANSVVIVQEVNDPLSLDKQREVRKFLRGGEEVK